MSHLFVNTLSLIRERNQANRIWSVLFTNVEFLLQSVSSIRDYLHMIPINYNGCSCSSSSKCVISSRDMLTRCYPLESILQTTFQCLYDQRCVNSLSTVKKHMNISSLSSPSRFSLNQTIGSILNELMIEELSINNISYEDYCNECSPSLCIYSYVDKKNIMEGIITLIGLYSGFVIICQIVTIFIVKKIFSGHRRIIPTIN